MVPPPGADPTRSTLLPCEQSSPIRLELYLQRKMRRVVRGISPFNSARVKGRDAKDDLDLGLMERLVKDSPLWKNQKGRRVKRPPKDNGNRVFQNSI